MQAVTAEVRKLEDHVEEARRELRDMKAGEEYEESVVDQIYNWHVRAGLGDMPADPDKMDFETKRLAVESSGVIVPVYPVGWVDPYFGEMPRILVTWGTQPPNPREIESTREPRRTLPLGQPAAPIALEDGLDLAKQQIVFPRRAGTAPSG
jgi:hypothetical protein